MIQRRKLRCFVIIVTCSQLLGPPVTSAVEPTGPEPQLQAIDIALDPAGALRGTVLDENGQPRSAAKVIFRKGGAPVTAVTTGSTGQFLVPELRPGLYQVQTPAAVHLLRVWAVRTAPPVARPAALLVDRLPIVRGQPWNPWQRALILSGVIATSGVIGGVIGYNIKDDAS